MCWQRRMNPAGCCGQLTGPRLPAVAMAGAWSWAPGLVSVCRRWVLGVEIMITCEPSTSAMSAPARGVGRIGDKGPGRGPGLSRPPARPGNPQRRLTRRRGCTWRLAGP